MRVLKGLTVVVLVTFAIAQPVAAHVVSIEATVALTDRSDASVEQALRRALDTCVRGALAMGMSSMWVDGASVLSDSVTLRIVATDEDSESKQKGAGGGDEPHEDDLL